MLGGRLVHLVLHLEHDGDVLHPVLEIAEDEVALAAERGVIVLLEIGVREHGPHFPVEHVAAVRLEGFADHLGGHPGFQVLVVVDLLLRHLQLGLVLLTNNVLVERRLLGRKLGRRPQLEDGRVQVRNFLVLGGNSGPDGQLLPIALCGHLLLEAGNFPFLRQNRLVLLEQLRLVRLLRRHSLRPLLGLILRMQLGQPALDLGVEFGPADLGNDGSVIDLIDREDTSALGAFQFVHLILSVSLS